MIQRIHRRFTIPEYREKKVAYFKMGYREIDYKEKGIKVHVILEVEDTIEHIRELNKLETCLTKKGPYFFPVLLGVTAAFILLAIFTVIAIRSIKDGTGFDLTGNALGFLIPAGFALLFATIYTYFYFKINNYIMIKFNPSKEEFEELVDKIKNS